MRADRDGILTGKQAVTKAQELGVEIEPRAPHAPLVEAQVKRLRRQWNMIISEGSPGTFEDRLSRAIERCNRKPQASLLSAEAILFKHVSATAIGGHVRQQVREQIRRAVRYNQPKDTEYEVGEIVRYWVDSKREAV